MDDNYIQPEDQNIPDKTPDRTFGFDEGREPDAEKLSNGRVSFFRWIWSFLLMLMASCFFILLIIFNAPVLQDWALMLKGSLVSEQQQFRNSKISLKQDIKNLERRLNIQKKKLERMTPRRPYLIIDTSENYFYLKKGDVILREGSCSTGSYTLLRTENEKQQWIFKTPRGMFRIRNKLTRPVWKLPDWAFIEEGRPVPPLGSPDRSEYGVLGDYGLQLGRGYMIHGTLYQRFLGLPVTHGCVRLGDEDLEYVYKKLTFGSKVFMY